jgi:glycosyltransferase involved in cell wall biosynthesis
MTVSALHISHTDIDGDSRILKEIASLKEANIVEIHGIGISEKGRHSGRIRAVRNYSKSVPIKFAPLRRLLKMIALVIVYVRLAGMALRCRATIVHCHDWFVLPIGVLHKLIWSSKIIYDAHELESDTNTRSWLRKRGAYWVEWVFLRWVTGFITVSPSILDWYRFEFKEIEPSAVILNAPAINAERLGDVRSRESDLRRKYGIEKEKSIGVYLGGLETGRGLDVIIDAISRIQDETHFLVIGYGSYEEALRRKASELECENVTFVGKIPHERVVDYIGGCDYGVCLIEPVSLSDVYSLPNKLFEYVCAGLYVFGSNLPEIEKFLVDTKFGEVVPFESGALSSAIIEADFSARRDSPQEELQTYSWHHQEQALYELYQSVLAEVDRK